MKNTVGLALGAALLAAGGAAWAQTAAAPSYKVVKTVALGAPDRWDYVVYDPPSHRVYVAHGDRVTVVDAQEGRVLGEVTGMPGGTHGIGIANGKGYTDDGRAGEVVVFDPKTFQVLKRVKAKPDADGITVDPASGHVFVVDGDSATVSVVDPKSDQIIATVDGGGGLEYAAPDGAGKVYVNGAEKKEIVRIDVKTNKVDARWPITGCVNPHGLAIDPAAHRLFSSCSNQVMAVIDTTDGSPVATLPIGQGTDAAAFDPSHMRAFSSNGDGTVTVIGQKDGAYAVLGAVTTQVTGRTMSVDPASGRLFVAAADIDPNAKPAPRPDGRPGRPMPLPGSLKLLFLDPVR